MPEHGARLIRAAVLVAAAASLVGTTVLADPAAAAPATAPAPLLPAEHGRPNGRYIVVLKPGAAGEQPVEAARRAGGRGLHPVSRGVNGFRGAPAGRGLAR